MTLEAAQDITRMKLTKFTSTNFCELFLILSIQSQPLTSEMLHSTPFAVQYQKINAIINANIKLVNAKIHA